VDFDALLADPDARRTGGRGLLVDQHLADMPEDMATKARAALATRRSDREVAEAFGSAGYTVSDAAVRNWRIKHGERKT
jgi:hypothetical protein